MNDIEAFGSPLETCDKVADVYKSASITRDFSLENEDSENIPYHARETAQPFTYGGLTEGFSRSQLNHVECIFDEPEVENFKQSFSKGDANLNNLEATTNIQVIPLVKDKKKKSNKGKFQQTDDYVINKIKQKDKHALLTKKLRNDQCENYTRNISKNINNKIILGGNEITDEREVMNILDNNLNRNTGNSTVQPLPASNELQRCETPSFPFEETINFSYRSSSPYPTLNPQNCSPSVKNKNEREIIKKNNTKAQPIDKNFVKFAKDTSKLWYKPHITREEALIILRNATPGSFIIRDSTTYKNSFGLVLRVSRPPVNYVATNSNGELVRHYLLEPTDCGVRLKGYHNEPAFTSLSAFVYQHSVDELALPCKLIIPNTDLSLSSGQADLVIAQEQLLAQGAACNVLYLFSYNTESLTGDEAIRKASKEIFIQFNNIKPIEVHFKVSKYGVTLTDNKRLLFFRRHYSAQNISYFGIEPDNRLWKISNKDDGNEEVLKTIFAFVARPLAGGNDNQCHIFCDLSVKQPASAIISFTQKVLPQAVIGKKII